MREIQDNIWNYLYKGFIIIPTNGFVKTDGTAVMGRGLAFQAANKFEDLRSRLGYKLKNKGNHVYDWPDHSLITFPVKHNWWEEANPPLIEKSVQELLQYIKEHDQNIKYYMPRVGCGNGRLKWEDVMGILDPLYPYVQIINL